MLKVASVGTAGLLLAVCCGGKLLLLAGASGVLAGLMPAVVPYGLPAGMAVTVLGMLVAFAPDSAKPTGRVGTSPGDAAPSFTATDLDGNTVEVPGDEAEAASSASGVPAIFRKWAYMVLLGTCPCQAAP